MSRRKFIIVLFAGIALALVAPFFFYYSLVIEQSIIYFLEKEYFYLKLNKEGLKKYSKEYVKSTKAGHLDALKLVFLVLTVKNPEQSFRTNFIVKDFIVSTDFFYNKMDEAKEVNYIGKFHPYLRPCSNPFSANFYPTA